MVASGARQNSIKQIECITSWNSLTQNSVFESETTIDERIQTVLRHGQFIMGPEIAELEAVLAEYVGVKHCITVSSGTQVSKIAMRALRIGPGDEVITVPLHLDQQQQRRSVWWAHDLSSLISIHQHSILM